MSTRYKQKSRPARGRLPKARTYKTAPKIRAAAARVNAAKPNVRRR